MNVDTGAEKQPVAAVSAAHFGPISISAAELDWDVGANTETMPWFYDFCVQSYEQTATVPPEGDDARLRAEIADLTPSNETLLEWASRPENQPPKEWWDDETNPFEVSGDE